MTELKDEEIFAATQILNEERAQSQLQSSVSRRLPRSIPKPLKLQHVPHVLKLQGETKQHSSVLAKQRVLQNTFSADFDPIFGPEGIFASNYRTPAGSVQDAIYQYVASAASALQSVEQFDPSAARTIQKVIDFLTSEMRCQPELIQQLTESRELYYLKYLEIEKKFKEMQNTIDELKLDVEKRKKTIFEIDDLISDQKSQIRGLNNEVYQLEEKVKNKDSIILSLSADLQTVKNQLTKSMRQNNIYAAEIVEVRSRFEDYIKQIMKGDLKQSELINKIATVEDALYDALHRAKYAEMIQKDAEAALNQVNFNTEKRLENFKLKEQQDAAEIKIKDEVIDKMRAEVARLLAIQKTLIAQCPKAAKKAMAKGIANVAISESVYQAGSRMNDYGVYVVDKDVQSVATFRLQDGVYIMEQHELSQPDLYQDIEFSTPSIASELNDIAKDQNVEAPIQALAAQSQDPLEIMTDGHHEAAIGPEGIQKVVFVNQSIQTITYKPLVKKNYNALIDLQEKEAKMNKDIKTEIFVNDKPDEVLQKKAVLNKYFVPRVRFDNILMLKNGFQYKYLKYKKMFENSLAQLNIRKNQIEQQCLSQFVDEFINLIQKDDILTVEAKDRDYELLLNYKQDRGQVLKNKYDEYIEHYNREIEDIEHNQDNIGDEESIYENGIKVGKRKRNKQGDKQLPKYQGQQPGLRGNMSGIGLNHQNSIVNNVILSSGQKITSNTGNQFIQGKRGLAVKQQSFGLNGKQTEQNSYQTNSNKDQLTDFVNDLKIRNKQIQFEEMEEKDRLKLKRFIEVRDELLDGYKRQVQGVKDANQLQQVVDSGKFTMQDKSRLNQLQLQDQQLKEKLPVLEQEFLGLQEMYLLNSHQIYQYDTNGKLINIKELRQFRPDLIDIDGVLYDQQGNKLTAAELEAINQQLLQEKSTVKIYQQQQADLQLNLNNVLISQQEDLHRKFLEEEERRALHNQNIQKLHQILALASKRQLRTDSKLNKQELDDMGIKIQTLGLSGEYVTLQQVIEGIGENLRQVDNMIKPKRTFVQRQPLVAQKVIDGNNIGLDMTITNYGTSQPDPLVQKSGDIYRMEGNTFVNPFQQIFLKKKQFGVKKQRLAQILQAQLVNDIKNIQFQFLKRDELLAMASNLNEYNVFAQSQAASFDCLKVSSLSYKDLQGEFNKSVWNQAELEQLKRDLNISLTVQEVQQEQEEIKRTLVIPQAPRNSKIYPALQPDLLIYEYNLSADQLKLIHLDSPPSIISIDTPISELKDNQQLFSLKAQQFYSYNEGQVNDAVYIIQIGSKITWLNKDEMIKIYSDFDQQMCTAIKPFVAELGEFQYMQLPTNVEIKDIEWLVKTFLLIIKDSQNYLADRPRSCFSLINRWLRKQMASIQIVQKVFLNLLVSSIFYRQHSAIGELIYQFITDQLGVDSYGYMLLLFEEFGDYALQPKDRNTCWWFMAPKTLVYPLFPLFNLKETVDQEEYDVYDLILKAINIRRSQERQFGDLLLLLFDTYGKTIHFTHMYKIFQSLYPNLRTAEYNAFLDQFVENQSIIKRDEFVKYFLIFKSKQPTTHNLLLKQCKARFDAGIGLIDQSYLNQQQEIILDELYEDAQKAILDEKSLRAFFAVERYIQSISLFQKEKTQIQIVMQQHQRDEIQNQDKHEAEDI